MKIRKFISAILCASMLACLYTGCTENTTDTEETEMQNAETTTAVTEKIIEEIPA